MFSVFHFIGHVIIQKRLPRNQDESFTSSSIYANRKQFLLDYQAEKSWISLLIFGSKIQGTRFARELFEFFKQHESI